MALFRTTSRCQYNWLFLIICIAIKVKECAGYYVPGAKAQNYAPGEEVKLKFNKLTSSQTLFPLDYFSFPLCHAPKVYQDNQNLGEFLVGDKVLNSPYVIKMKQDLFCQQLCVTNLGREEQPDIALKNQNKVVKAIRNGYNHNWILDNLDPVYRREKYEEHGGESDDTTSTTVSTLIYGQGFPLGFVSVSKGVERAYIFNHVNIEIMYYTERYGIGKQQYRIVGFHVEPFSIAHNFQINDEPSNPNMATIKNPIKSCDPDIADKPHTDFQLVHAYGQLPKPASGKTLFTYDVIWTEKRDTKWANRWDIYLQHDMKNINMSGTPTLICNFIIFVFLLAIVVQKISVDQKASTKVAASEPSSDLEKMPVLSSDDTEKPSETQKDTAAASGSNNELYQDIFFRPPRNSPTYYAVFLGTGFQILLTLLLVLCLAAMGFFSSSQRGALVTALFLCYCSFGGVSGYFTGRVHRLFHGSDRLPLERLTIMGLPGLWLALFFLRQLAGYALGSTLAVPVSTITVVCLLGAIALCPSVALGLYYGYHGQIDFQKLFTLPFKVESSNLNTMCKNINPCVIVGFGISCCIILGTGIFFFIITCLLLLLPFAFSGLILWFAEKQGAFDAFDPTIPAKSLGVARPTSEDRWMMMIPTAIGLLAHIILILNSTSSLQLIFAVALLGALAHSKDPTFSPIYVGILPFSVLNLIYSEVYETFWGMHYFDFSGFYTLITTLVYLAMVGVVSVLYTYKLLQVREATNRHKWWYSFIAAGSNGFYFFFQPNYSEGPDVSFFSLGMGLYIGNMVLLSLCMFLLSGAWGTFCSLWFIRKVFHVKHQEEALDSLDLQGSASADLDIVNVSSGTLSVLSETKKDDPEDSAL